MSLRDDFFRALDVEDFLRVKLFQAYELVRGGIKNGELLTFSLPEGEPVVLITADIERAADGTAIVICKRASNA